MAKDENVISHSKYYAIPFIPAEIKFPRYANLNLGRAEHVLRHAKVNLVGSNLNLNLPETILNLRKSIAD